MAEYKINIEQHGLSSIIYVEKNGVIIFERKIDNTVLYSALSQSRKYMAVHLGVNGSESSCNTVLFDITNNEILFLENLGLSSIKDLYFVGKNDELYVDTDYGAYQVSFAGKVIDLERFYNHVILSANHEAINYIDLYLENNDFSELSKRNVIRCLDHFIDKQYNQFNGVSWALIAFRRKGELLEELGESQEAFLSYIDALFLDEKCGVKRKIAQLSKEIGLDNKEFPPSNRVKMLLSSCQAERKIVGAKSESDWENFIKGDSGKFTIWKGKNYASDANTTDSKMDLNEAEVIRAEVSILDRISYKIYRCKLSLYALVKKLFKITLYLFIFFAMLSIILNFLKY